MIFDTVDFELLRLIDINRYLPLNLKKNYDSLMFERSVRTNLQVHTVCWGNQNFISGKNLGGTVANFNCRSWENRGEKRHETL